MDQNELVQTVRESRDLGRVIDSGGIGLAYPRPVEYAHLPVLPERRHGRERPSELVDSDEVIAVQDAFGLRLSGSGTSVPAPPGRIASGLACGSAGGHHQQHCEHAAKFESLAMFHGCGH